MGEGFGWSGGSIGWRTSADKAEGWSLHLIVEDYDCWTINGEEGGYWNSDYGWSAGILGF